MKIERISNCARCGQTHDDLELKPLSNHPTFTHFTTCPILNEPVLIQVDEKDDADEIILDKFHYHEFLERAYIICNVVEEICNHPVKDAHKDVQEQVDKILMECAELYKLVGQKDQVWEDGEYLPDLRNKLTPMLTLVGLVEDGVINDPKFKTMVKETLQKVKENVDYIAKRNSYMK